MDKNIGKFSILRSESLKINEFAFVIFRVVAMFFEMVVSLITHHLANLKQHFGLNIGFHDKVIHNLDDDIIEIHDDQITQFLRATIYPKHLSHTQSPWHGLILTEITEPEEVLDVQTEEGETVSPWLRVGLH